MKLQAIIIVLPFCFLEACMPSDRERITDGTTTIESKLLVDDGAWCWFSDPRAVYHNGKKEQIYFGYINSMGDVCIGSKELKSEKIEMAVLHDTLEVDDHNVPSILLQPDGKLLAFYNEHNGNVYLRKSVYSEDIGSWEKPVIICKESEQYNYCYTNCLLFHPAMVKRV